MIFKILPQNFFQKKHPDFGGLETNIFLPIFFANGLLQMNSIYNKNCSGHLIGISSKCHKFWGQNQNLTNQYS